MFLWTRTAGFDPADIDTQRRALDALTVPTVGYHLDRWWGLDRETDVGRSPWFTLDLLCTAHGAEEWADAGINHVWFAPAVSARWVTNRGTHRRVYESDVAFVGNLMDYAHAEWAPYRRSINDTFADLPGWRVFPGVGKRAIRGQALADIYASGKVFIGDSCLVGKPVRYWSDRVPETLGRGGFLIHPWVEGIDAQYPDLVTYPLGDLDNLRTLVDFYLEDGELRKGTAEQNRRHVAAHHTYEQRMIRLVDVLAMEGLK